ncbi:MAG: MFS transporter [Thermoplasmata archaeon]
MSPGEKCDGGISRRMQSTFHPYLIMVGIVTGVLMGALDNLIVTTAMPAIVGALHQPNGLALLIGAYITSSAVGMVIFGKLSDHFSKRIILLITLAIFIIGSILAGLSLNLPELIAFRAVQGFGSGGFLPVGLAVIAVILPPAARAKMTGAVTSFIGIAIVVGPEIGAFIVDTTSWRWVFYVNIPFGIVSLVLVWFLLSPLKPILRGKFDYLGSILLASWVSLLTFPLIEMAYSGWSLKDPLTIAFFVSGLVLLAFFLQVEMHVVEEPVIPLRMFKHKTIVFDSILSFFRGGVLFSISTFIAIFVTEVLFGTVNMLRNVLYGFVVPLVIGSILGGVLLPKLSYRFFCVIGTICMTLGFLPLLKISPSTQPYIFVGHFPVLGLVEGLIPIGFGVGFTMAATTLSAQYSAETRDIGASSSIVQFMGNIGGSIILSILTAFIYVRYKELDLMNRAISTNSGRYGINAIAMSSAIQESFIILFILSLFTIISAFFIYGRLPHMSREFKDKT